MKITVITVTYNSASTIVDTLRSIAQQTHPNTEHIVIDGASTDATLSLVHKHASPTARVLSEPDSGIYDAMNKGLQLATGDLVGFLNADDIFDNPNVLMQIAGAASDPSVAAVYGDLMYVSQNDLGRVVRHWRSGGFVPSRLGFGWMPPHPTFYVRRALVAELGTFDTGFRIASDYDFMLRLLRRPGVVVRYVPQVLVRMRTGGASNRSASALWRKSSEDWRALRKNGVGGLSSLLCKNLRKLPQFFARRAIARSSDGPG